MNETIPLPSGKVLPGELVGPSHVKYAAFTLVILLLTTCLLWWSLSGSKALAKIPGPQGIPLFGSLFDVSALLMFFTCVLWIGPHLTSNKSCATVMPRPSNRGLRDMEVFSE